MGRRWYNRKVRGKYGYMSEEERVKVNGKFGCMGEVGVTSITGMSLVSIGVWMGEGACAHMHAGMY